MSVFEFNTKLGARQNLHHNTNNLDDFFLYGHINYKRPLYRYLGKKQMSLARPRQLIDCKFGYAIISVGSNLLSCLFLWFSQVFGLELKNGSLQNRCALAKRQSEDASSVMIRWSPAIIRICSPRGGQINESHLSLVESVLPLALWRLGTLTRPTG